MDIVTDPLDAARVFLGPYLSAEGLEGQLLGKQAGAVYDGATKALADKDAEITRLRDALEDIAYRNIGNEMRFAEDDDTDYFLRCIEAIRKRARTALGERE